MNYLTFSYWNKYDNNKLKNFYIDKTNEEEKQVNLQESRKEKKTNHIMRYPRSQKFSMQSMINADFLCEVDSNHIFFKSASLNNNYVESHHIIPLSYQENFKVSLDVLGNLVSLCVVCHKKLHHASFDEKKEILSKLYNDRKEKLAKYGIEINYDEFLRLYKSNISEDE